MTDHEEWRSIPGIEGYEVSNLARVRSLTRTVKGVNREGKMLSMYSDDVGYKRVGIRVGKSTAQRVHRLIALAFIGPPPFPGAVVRHLNDVKTDNRLENLAWGSKSDNARDSVANGTHGNHGKYADSCKWGHQLSGENLRVDPKSQLRICRSCARINGRERYRRIAGTTGRKAK